MEMLTIGVVNARTICIAEMDVECGVVTAVICCCIESRDQVQSMRRDDEANSESAFVK